MHFLLTLLIAGALTYAALCAALYFLQPRFVYFPSTHMYGTPADLKLDYEEVSLPSSGDARIVAWFIPSERDIGTLLFCHGNAGNISGRLELIGLFHRLGLNVMIFDYQGYGRSTGSPNEENTYADALAAWNYLTGERSIPAARIVVLGRSLGGPVAAWLALNEKPGALILESTFTSLADVGAAHYPFFPARLLTRYGYNTAEHVSKAACPILIAHRPADRIVPYEHGRKIFEQASEPKEFLERRGTHDDGFSTTGRMYADRMTDFIQKYIQE